MDRETARQEIRSRFSCLEYLEPSTEYRTIKDPEKIMYCCPFPRCNSGHKGHKDKDSGKIVANGAVKYYKETNTFYCFSCQKAGDYIDLFMIANKIDYNEALSLLADKIGITIDRYSPAGTAEREVGRKMAPSESPTSGEKAQGNIKPLPDTKTPENALETPTEPPADFTAYYKACRKRLTDPAAMEYLNRRGISRATAEAYWIGYDPEADPASAPGAMGSEYKPHPTPRLIIPTSTSHYIGRRIDKKREFSKMNPGGSTPAIFNGRVLFTQEVQEIFVVEGAFDALSIIEAGATALALNSTSNGKKLIELLRNRRTAATLILCPDNDKDPKTAENVKAAFAELAEGLKELNISCLTADINGEYKDANEHLTSDREAFIKAVEKARRQAAAKPDNTQYYIDALMAGEIERFKDEIKTGFANLDTVAGGGLYAGLYVLAASTSIGKTTFALQLADQLATGGRDVIFFSLEQSRLELVTKCIARRTAQKDLTKAVSSLAIRKGYMTPEIKQAVNDFKEATRDRLNIVEGNFACDISFISDYIRRYMKRNKARPVVFIDYLQILQPGEDAQRQGVREAIDSTITALKRLSRAEDLAIIIISSINRANYLAPFDLDSLKESGGIEYTCDVVWGLQLQCLNDDLFDKDKHIKEKREKIKEAKAANPRKIELQCLKNRYGKANDTCNFLYYPDKDLFIEDGRKEDGKEADELDLPWK